MLVGTIRCLLSRVCPRLAANKIYYLPRLFAKMMVKVLYVFRFEDGFEIIEIETTK